MAETKTYIVVNFQLEGFHNFPEARDLFPEVGFLSDYHRHIFHFQCKKKVYHDNRDVEFILFKREIQGFLIDKFYPLEGYPENHPLFSYYCDFGSMSCEMIARLLFEKFDLEYCSVFEDGENGAEIIK